MLIFIDIDKGVRKMSDVLQTALYELHVQLGAKMVDFAGYSMPVQYSDGILQEHLHTRAQAGLFDVSHMGQVLVSASAQALEAVFPLDIETKAVGQQMYSFLLNEAGGVEDDLMITRREKDFYLVVNAARKHEDVKRLQVLLGEDKVQWWQGRSLLALQGPAAVDVLASWQPLVRELAFMQGAEFDFDGVACWVSRSGYSGEDGFEISVPDTFVQTFFKRLLEDERVKPIGLGARDSLRLEAGLCLYGQDLREDISPLEAGLVWAIAKSRRPDGAKAGGYVGSEALAAQFAQGVKIKRVGLRPEGKLPLRAHTPLFDLQGNAVGEISSGGFAPSLNAPVAMGFVSSEVAALGTALQAEVRGKLLPVTVVKMPFIDKRYQK